MTDQHHSAKAQEPEPTARPYNKPNLSHCDTLSMALHVKAAKALKLIHTKAPQPSVTIYIKDPYSYKYLACYPWLKQFVAKDREWDGLRGIKVGLECVDRGLISWIS
jgi:hypothetical protein